MLNKYLKTSQIAMMQHSLVAIILTLIFASCSDSSNSKSTNQIQNLSMQTESKTDTATFGQGCFWCAEATFQQLKGVISVKSGYSGGLTENPSYKEVCSGTTGHAEVCQIVFDPSVISYSTLLQAFWASHDPTTLNRQGNDIGTQYRSVIFYHNSNQKELAETYKKKLNESGAFSAPIVTEISPFSRFYVAEDYHQNYYNLNGEAPYCQFVIKPKLEKFKKVFGDQLK